MGACTHACKYANTNTRTHMQGATLSEHTHMLGCTDSITQACTHTHACVRACGTHMCTCAHRMDEADGYACRHVHMQTCRRTRTHTYVCARKHRNTHMILAAPQLRIQEVGGRQSSMAATGLGRAQPILSSALPSPTYSPVGLGRAQPILRSALAEPNLFSRRPWPSPTYSPVGLGRAHPILPSALAEPTLYSRRQWPSPPYSPFFLGRAQPILPSALAETNLFSRRPWRSRTYYPTATT